jgi:hypothetical protein
MIPSGLIVGYHGCDIKVAEQAAVGRLKLQPSSNTYDWLGHGIYGWQSDPQRAWEWALGMAKRKNSRIHKPAVLGLTIDLGHCFVAAMREHIALLSRAYERLQDTYTASGIPMPMNVGKSWMNRKLDCAVFEMMHRIRDSEGQRPFDTVLAYFPEGAAAYPGAAIRLQDHVQICVRNPRQILGYFIP